MLLWPKRKRNKIECKVIDTNLIIGLSIERGFRTTVRGKGRGERGVQGGNRSKGYMKIRKIFHLYRNSIRLQVVKFFHRNFTAYFSAQIYSHTVVFSVQVENFIKF